VLRVTGEMEQQLTMNSCGMFNLPGQALSSLRDGHAWIVYLWRELHLCSSDPPRRSRRPSTLIGSFARQRRSLQATYHRGDRGAISHFNKMLEMGLLSDKDRRGLDGG
jgi:hypothetical protein